MRAALQHLQDNADSETSGLLSAVGNAYKSWKGAGDTPFHTYISEPFLTSKESDELIEGLKKADYFDSMAYDAETHKWVHKSWLEPVKDPKLNVSAEVVHKLPSSNPYSRANYAAKPNKTAAEGEPAASNTAKSPIDHIKALEVEVLGEEGTGVLLPRIAALEEELTGEKAREGRMADRILALQTAVTSGDTTSEHAQKIAAFEQVLVGEAQTGPLLSRLVVLEEVLGSAKIGRMADRIAALQHAAAGGDRGVLEVIYRATDGPKWEHLQVEGGHSNWMTDADISLWTGVKVNGDGRVTELNLTGNGLRGTLPSGVGQLTELQKLDISNNKLIGRWVGFVVGWFVGGLVRVGCWLVCRFWFDWVLTLVFLYMACSLKGEVPSFARCKQLKELLVNQNQCTGECCSEPDGATCNRGRLFTDFAQIIAGVLPSFAECTRLQHFKCWGNQLTGASEPDVVPVHTPVEFLFEEYPPGLILSDISFSSEGEFPSFAENQQLTVCDVSYNMFVGECFQQFFVVVSVYRDI
jgi:hypothetical protein